MFAKKDFTNVEALMILYAIKAYNSKRNAAKFLNLSLDTLDKYLKMLEAELNTKLIVTHVRGCSLTPKGEQVLQNVNLLEQCLQNIYKLCTADKDVCGEVHVACDLSARNCIQPGSIQALYQKYPNINLCIDNAIGAPDIKEAYYDIYLSYEIPRGKDLHIIASKNISCYFFASKDYLQMHNKPKDIAELLQKHRLIIHKDVWKEIKKHLLCPIKTAKGVSLTNNSFIVSDVIMSGGGIGVLPYYLKNRDSHLICLNEIKCEAVNTLYLISPKSRKDIPKVRAILNFYKEMMQNL